MNYHMAIPLCPYKAWEQGTLRLHLVVNFKIQQFEFVVFNEF